jgi:hypothetical protein
MKTPGPRNLPASVAARLRAWSRRTGDDGAPLPGDPRPGPASPGRRRRRVDSRGSPGHLRDGGRAGRGRLRPAVDPSRGDPTRGRVRGDACPACRDVREHQDDAAGRPGRGGRRVAPARVSPVPRPPGSPDGSHPGVCACGGRGREAGAVQIRAFARRSGIPLGPDVAGDILPLLRAFLLPILDDVRRGTDELEAWPAGGPWR